MGVNVFWAGEGLVDVSLFMQPERHQHLSHIALTYSGGIIVILLIVISIIIVWVVMLMTVLL
jgi:hypothetical protein